jgi:hypothetical protein
LCWSEETKVPVADAESIRGVRRKFFWRFATASAKDLWTVVLALLGDPTSRDRLTGVQGLAANQSPMM